MPRSIAASERPSARATAVAAAAFWALCAPGSAGAARSPGLSCAAEISINLAGPAASERAISREHASSIPTTAVSVVVCRAKISRFAAA